MTKVNIHQAKTHLSRYIKMVQQGEKVIICKDNEPLAQIIPFRRKSNVIKKRNSRINIGARVKKGFFDPLTDTEFPGVGLKKSRRKK